MLPVYEWLFSGGFAGGMMGQREEEEDRKGVGLLVRESQGLRGKVRILFSQSWRKREKRGKDRINL